MCVCVSVIVVCVSLCVCACVYKKKSSKIRSNNIISGIVQPSFQLMVIVAAIYVVYVGYFYDVAPRRMYKNWQGKLAQLRFYSQG